MHGAHQRIEALWLTSAHGRDWYFRDITTTHYRLFILAQRTRDILQKLIQARSRFSFSSE